MLKSDLMDQVPAGSDSLYNLEAEENICIVIFWESLHIPPKYSVSGVCCWKDVGKCVCTAVDAEV